MTESPPVLDGPIVCGLDIDIGGIGGIYLRIARTNRAITPTPPRIKVELLTPLMTCPAAALGLASVTAVSRFVGLVVVDIPSGNISAIVLAMYTFANPS